MPVSIWDSLTSAAYPRTDQYFPGCTMLATGAQGGPPVPREGIEVNQTDEATRLDVGGFSGNAMGSLRKD